MPIDDLVEQAMRRWPNVPAVYGWLRLDRRGHWMLIDRGSPDFDEALHGKGSEITSPPILDFLGRNYLSDERGCWHWQNGPQRVFVDLDLAPFILRVVGEGSGAHLSTHTGFLVEPGSQAWLDGEGNLFLKTSLGPGVVHDLDLAQLEFDDSEAGEGDPPTRVLVGDHWLPISITAQPETLLGFRRRPRG
ncbi:MAG TPA: DUF2946 family protein [Burkholderiaceae bacterium]|jgi:hypothetical protein|nr:DUF2946 family protein [Burkholderiaceae bacterium]